MLAGVIDALAALQDVYAEADAKHAGWTCPASTECCRFGVTGREPYITSIEELALRKAIAARGGPRALAKSTRGLPIAERPCPLLTIDGRCSVYALRPLGCRTFYCDRATQAEPVRQRDVNELVGRIKAIASRHTNGGENGRPLTRALADLFDAPKSARRR